MPSDTSPIAPTTVSPMREALTAAHPPRWLGALAALLVLAICIPPMLVGLGARDSTHTMENVAIVVSQETWTRAHRGDDYRWYLTYNDQRVRLAKPPMVTWLHMLAWVDLDPDSAVPDQLIERARLVAVAMGALVILATFWAGLTLADLRLALTSAMLAGTTLLLQRQARTASYDIHFTAWTALAIASGLWAMAPRQSVLSWARVALGWGVCGLALAAATYSKNPLTYIVSVVPLAIGIAMLPRRRLHNTIGLLAAVALSLLIVLPWYITVSKFSGDVESSLMTEFEVPARGSQPIYYYLGLFGLIAPWTIWLFAGLAHPFMDGRRTGMQRRLFTWLWFVTIFIIFSIPDAKQQRYILPIIPAAALLMGFVWRDHDALLRRREQPRGYDAVVLIHGLSLLLASIGLGVFLGWQRPLLDIFSSTEHTPLVLGEVTPAAALIVAAILSALAITAWRCHAGRRPMRCLVATVVWGAIYFAVLWWAYGDAPSGDHPIKPIARNERALIGDAPIRSLRVPEHAFILNEEFRIYFGRQIPWITPDELDEFADRTNERGLVLARQEPAYETAMQAAGYLPVREVRTDTDVMQTLWQRP